MLSDADRAGNRVVARWADRPSLALWRGGIMGAIEGAGVMIVQGIEDFRGTDRFVIERRLGAGGMGVVYEAYDRLRRERVALKTLRHTEPAAIYRIKREFRALVDVTHPNLVALYELISAGDQWFFTMQLVDGVSFLHHVRPGAEPADAAMPNVRSTTVAGRSDTLDPAPPSTIIPPVTEPPETELLVAPSTHSYFAGFDEARLRAALRQLAEGVCALHEMGKLHRDIKPSNVLVTREGHVMLLDFGLAAELEQDELHHSTEQHIVGTAAYMAPEQAAGQSLSPASDWYAVGVMLYESLTGRLPFVGKRLEVLMDKQKYEPPAPCELLPDIPHDLNTLCVDLLRRRPDARPAGRDVLRRLGCGTGEAIAAESLRPSPPRGAPFVGRQRHLTALADAFVTTKQGQAVVVYVQGRSGMGKSVLVQRFLDELAGGDEAVVLAGRCYEQESVPYKALDSLVDALSRYLMRLSRLEADALMPRDVLALARVFPVLRRVPAVAEAPRRTFEIPDQQELRRRAFGALRELLLRLGDRRPLVLFIDDLQWGDVDSAALLADLLRPPDPPVLLLLGSYRSEYATASPCLRLLLGQPASPDAGLQRRELEVNPLSIDEARDLALALFGQDDAATVAGAGAIARESGGSPYFVYELVQYIQAGAELGEHSSSAAETTLDHVLWARVLRLSQQARRLLQVVSVAGRPLKQAEAYQAAALAGEQRAALALLRAGHLVRSTGPGEQDEIETYHDRIRETVVEHLPSEQLKNCHHQLAVALEASGRADPEALAVHLEGAGEPARAGEYYAVAAAQAVEALAFDRAAKLYRLALGLRPLSGAEERTIRAKLGDALANAGRGAEAAREFLAAAAGASAAERLDLQRHAAMQSLISGHIDDGLAALGTVLAAADMKLARTPLRALLTLLVRRAQLRIRGLKFRERDTTQITAEELSRIDICWSAAVGLSIVDTIRGADFQTRSLLLALRAGEPYRIARALAWEAAHTTTAGGPARQRTAKLLEAARTLAERINHPHALGLVTLSAGIAGYMEGRWKAGREYSEQAEAIFRERCTGVTWELDTAHSFSNWSLFFLGEVAELVRRLPLLRKEAHERGDLYAATNLGTFVGHLTWLAADDPDGARRDMADVMGQWSHEGFHVQHLTGLMGQIQIELYAGDGAAAWKLVTERWPALRRSLFLRVQTVRIFMHNLRARSALAAARDAADPQPLLAAAERDARRIQRERMPWAEPLAHLLRAGVAAFRQNTVEAVALVGAAVTGFDAADMGLFAAAARRRQGELVGGDAGRALVADANAWMTAQKIQNPTRMTDLYAPGFPT